MNMENNIYKFQQWALQMGCRLEHIPCEEALETIYKSRQYKLFDDIIKRIQHIAVVEEARKNFVIETKRQRDNKLSIYSPDITGQYDAYVKVQDLKKVKQCEQQSLEHQKNEYSKVYSVLVMKNVRLTKEYAKESKLQTLKNIYMLKVRKLEGQISEEVKKAVSISNLIPLQSSKYLESECTKLVKQALNELNDLDTNLSAQCRDNEDPMDIKLKLWQKMRQIFYSLPNSTVYEHITKLKAQQMQNFTELVEKTSEKDEMEPHLSDFQQVLLDTKIKLTEYVAQYIHARTERTESEELFAEIVEQFGNELKEQIPYVNENEEQLNELIGLFVYQYNLRNMKKCQNKVLATQIHTLNEAIEESAKNLDNHELLMQAVKQLYLNINVCINRIRWEIMRMKNMKVKLLYPKNMFNNQVKGSSLRVSKWKADFLISDSFEMAGDNVFSSTKVDFDATNRNDQSVSFMRPTHGKIYTPTNTSEVLLFMETNFDNFKSSVNPSLASLLPTSLSNIKLDGQASSLLFMSSNQALSQLKKDLKWVKISSEQLPKEPIMQIDVVDEKFYKERQKNQNQQLSELLDKTEATVEYFEHILQRNKEIYNFILENVLKNYVPPKKIYKNYNFNQYEAEFRNYYSIIENSM